MSFTRWRSLVDGAEVDVGSEIPDSDLTQYSLTDPDDRITVTSETAYEARMPDGANEESRLYANRPLTDFPDTFRWEFDFEVLARSSSDGERVYFGWDTQSDLTNTNSNNFLGLWYRGDDVDEIAVVADDGSQGTVASNLDTNTVYTIQTDIDVISEDVTVRVIEDGSQLGEASSSFSGADNLDWHYPHQAFNIGFSSPGNLDYDLTNNRFESI